MFYDEILVVVKGPKLKGKLKKPKPDLTQWELDPLFEDNTEEVPFVSTSAEARLMFRAIYNRDKTLLKKQIDDKKKIFSLNFEKSMADDVSPIGYAVREGWMDAVKMLASKETRKMCSNRAAPPECLLETAGTGTYNWRHLGIRRVRRINLSRGNREGNNAFTKDQNSIQTARHAGFGINLSDLMLTEDPLWVYKFLQKNKMVNLLTDDPTPEKALRWGHTQLAIYLIEKDQKENRLGSNYSRYHLEALTYGAKDKWDAGKLREVSVRKTSGWDGATPMHFACANPCVGPLKQLFSVSKSNSADFYV